MLLLPKTMSRVFLGALLLGVSGAPPVLAEDAPIAVLPKRCEQAATNEVAALGLNPTMQRAIFSKFSSSSGPVGYRARFTGANCRGYLVMNFDSLCRMQNSYTTGNCGVPGIAQW